jgi:hypothetical protein
MQRIPMSLSDYQVDTVIKAYLRNMTIRASSVNDAPDVDTPEDRVVLSEKAMKKMFFKRIRKNMTQKFQRH